METDTVSSSAGSGRPRPRHRHRKVRPLRIASAVVAVVALVEQLRRPRAQRTWHGAIGFVPYDFRKPTWERARARLWSPDEPQLLTPRIFGVGWTPNLGRMAALVRGRIGR
jgi:hypothetical protein